MKIPNVSRWAILCFCLLPLVPARLYAARPGLEPIPERDPIPESDPIPPEKDPIPPGRDPIAGSPETERIAAAAQALGDAKTEHEAQEAVQELLSALQALDRAFGDISTFPRKDHDKLVGALEHLNTSMLADLQGSSELFIRGDSNGDGKADLSDAIHVLSFLFTSGEPSGCLKAADGNRSGSVDISDPVYLLAFHFLGGPSPPSPYPDCGRETVDGPLSCAQPTCAAVSHAMQPAQGAPPTKISYSCDGTYCLCRGDPDCQNLSESGRCLNGYGTFVCVNFGGQVICMCVQKGGL